ncbi:MAG: hypothetical protein ACAH81_04325 [Actinomycetota bacterium]
MKITVDRDGRESAGTAPAGVLYVEGDLTAEETAEVRKLFNDLGDSTFSTMTLSYGTSEVVGKATPAPFSDLWLGIVALNELPQRRYRVGIVASPE